MEQNKKTAIIVGGGVAGIKCAYDLKKNGFNIILLETSDYLGGRMKNIQFCGQVVEEGANWVQGLFNEETGEQNPIWTMAQKVKLQFQKEDDSELILDTADGQDLTKEGGQSYDKLEKFIDKFCDKLQNQNYQIKNDKDLQTTLQEKGWQKNDKLNELAQWLMLDLGEGERISKVSTYHSIKDEIYGENEIFVCDQRGYSIILQDMIEFIQEDVYLNRKVNTIEYQNGFVKIETIKLKDNQIQIFEGNFAVCTVSIGVLKKQIIQFNPPLPEFKMKAINQLEMGVYCKVFFNFQQRFWPNNRQYIMIISDKIGYFTLFRSLKKLNDSNILVSFSIGDEAKRLEKITDIDCLKDEIQDHLFKAFQKFNQKKTKKVNGVEEPLFDKSAYRPNDIHICKWESDERFCGSFSYKPVGAFKDGTWNHLVCPLNGYGQTFEDQDKNQPVLYFSGEAFDDQQSSYLQGAFLSAQKTIFQILKYYQ